MATFTAKLGLRKPAPGPPGDNVNVVTDLNDNFDKIDASIGTFVCTSGTRPTGSNRFVGQKIYETNTRLGYIWDGSVWQPDSHITYVSQTGRIIINSGSHVQNVSASSNVTVNTGITALLGFVAFNGDADARPNCTVANNRNSWPTTSGPNVGLRVREAHTNAALDGLAFRVDWIAIGTAP